MKNFTTTLCILGLSGIAHGDVLMDQIGADDGSSIDATNAFANQDFEASFDAYDIAAVDDFTGAGESINSAEMVLSGWNGYLGPDAITGWTANLYTDSNAAGSSLTGDIASQYVDAADANISATWSLAGYDLVQLDVSMVAANGVQLVGVIPANEYGVNGQTAMGWSTLGDGAGAGQANPNGGFGFGPWQAFTGGENMAIRLMTGGPADPCDSALGFCPEDIDMNGSVNVDDLLIVMGNWGQSGDGTYRPAGDVHPPPNGDCNVNVDDLLAMMGAFGEVCVIEGGCCLGDGSCTTETPANCSAAGGDYLGDDSDCTNCVTVACCVGTACSDLTDSACAAIGGTSYAGDCGVVICPEPLDNDTCDTAAPAYDGDTAIDTTGAITDGPADFNVCDNFGVEDVFNDIWFSYTATCDGNVTMTMCNTIDFDSRISAYDACGGNQLGCNDDALSGLCGLMSELTLEVTNGQEMLIRVGGFSEGAGGTGTMNISCSAPEPGSCCLTSNECLEGFYEADCILFGGSWNGAGTDCSGTPCEVSGDTCEEPMYAVDGANPFDTSLANASGYGQPDDTQCDGTFLDWGETGADVWMVYTPAGAGTLTVSLCDAASYDTSLVLYSGNDCSSLTQVACNGDTTVETGCQSYYSGVYDLAVDGSDIYIRIGGWQAAAGPGTCTITFTEAGATGACCVAGQCIGENTSPECDAFGGLWFNGSSCAEVECPAVYTAGGCDTDEGCVCFVDGDDSETDCNGGGNLVVPTYSDLYIGQSVCGTSSVFVDGPTGGTYRDLDWFHSSDINAGGTFDFTIGANSTCLILIVNEDTGAVDYVADHAAGYMNTTTLDIPAGNWAIVATVSDWNTAWICGSGDETYTMLVE